MNRRMLIGGGPRRCRLACARCAAAAGRRGLSGRARSAGDAVADRGQEAAARRWPAPATGWSPSGPRGHIVVLDGRRRDLAAGPGAGQLRPDGGAISRARSSAGPSATTASCSRRPTAASPGRSSSTVAPSTTWSWPTSRPSSPRSPDSERTAGAGHRGRALQGAGPRQAVPRRLVRERHAPASSSAPTTCCSRPRDGGKTWQSWFDRAENPRFMNLYSIRPAAGALYLAGEAGTVLQARSGDPSASSRCRWTMPAACSASPTPADAVLVYGLRGNAFRSTDGGATWTKIDTQAARDDRRRQRHARYPATVDPGRPGRSHRAQQRRRRDASTCSRCSAPLPLTSITDAGAGRLAVTGPFGVMVVGARRHRGNHHGSPRHNIEAMPVVRDIKDFDLKSGNRLERLIFNNRVSVMLACLVVTVVLGFRRPRRSA